MNSLHIAQQSRRDKLRIQQDIFSSNFPSDALTNNSAASICYDPSDFCSEMINFSADAAIPPPFNPFASQSAAAADNWAPNHTSSIFPNSTLDVKPHYLGYENSPSLYQNALQELVTSSNHGRSSSYGLEFASLRRPSATEPPWAVAGSELLLLPDQLRLKSLWSGGEIDNFPAAPRETGEREQQLSLSLSSVPSPKVHEAQIVEVSPPSNHNLPSGRAVGGVTHRNPGPLGPFTGYATILRSSRFLRPAQQLLEELCCVAGPKEVEISDASDEILEDVRVSSDVGSFGIDGSSDKGREASCSTDACRPEYMQLKGKLLFMQDEVGKRYKQYHQQMQMVVSSFESVAGLSAATPYVSLALKMIAKHFRCLKNAINDQLKSMKNALRDEFSSPSAGASGNKGDPNASVLKFFDQSFQKQKGAGILEGQHIWRPQRGLPERAVSILRAWLFDHFLHPYPTDTDKHMLATQTGLTRNQVSNWFINARVRVWKPMVEEIHMLETKGSSDNAGKPTDGKAAIEGCHQAAVDDGSSQSLNRLRMRAIPDKQVIGCSSLGPTGSDVDRAKAAASLWNQEKRSRIEYHVPGALDGSLMGFVPSHRGGVGSVSLTLGLTQSPDGGGQMQQERHLSHYGGQMIRDFVG